MVLVLFSVLREACPVRYNALSLVAALSALLIGAASAQSPLYYVPGSTRRVSQVTGDFDRPLAIPTRSLTQSQAQLQSTDLGSTFEHKGRLVFLFGDTNGGHGGYLDPIAFSDSTDPWQLTVDIPVGPGGIWKPILPPGLSYGAFCVPSHGISINDVIYVVYTQNSLTGDYMKRSFLIASDNDGATWRTVYQLDNYSDDDPRFVNVYLAQSGDFIYMFGSGEYRASSPTLARIPVGSIEDKQQWQYFAGGTPDAPIWSASVADAVELFNQPQVGEFSCCYIDALEQWVMLYNADNPRGITMRTASQPWGPWSTPQVIMDPSTDLAYGNFMHVSWDVLRCDFFSDLGRENDWGGEYGPYLIPRFTTGTAEQCELYYTMSSWNPYQVHLMKSIVSNQPPAGSPATESRRLNHDLWNRYPAEVAGEFDYQDEPWLTTYVGAPNADWNRGWLWQKLPSNATQVSFTVHGGHGEVLLLENSSGLPAAGDVATVASDLHNGLYGRIVRRVTGMNNNNDFFWTWSLDAYDRSELVVAVVDNVTNSWGFSSFSELNIITETEPSSVTDWALY